MQRTLLSMREIVFFFYIITKTGKIKKLNKKLSKIFLRNLLLKMSETRLHFSRRQTTCECVYSAKFI